MEDDPKDLPDPYRVEQAELISMINEAARSANAAIAEENHEKWADAAGTYEELRFAAGILGPSELRELTLQEAWRARGPLREEILKVLHYNDTSIGSRIGPAAEIRVSFSADGECWQNRSGKITAKECFVEDQELVEMLIDHIGENTKHKFYTTKDECYRIGLPFERTHKRDPADYILARAAAVTRDRENSSTTPEEKPGKTHERSRTLGKRLNDLLGRGRDD